MSKLTDILYDFYSEMKEVEEQDPIEEDALNPDWKQQAEIVKDYEAKIAQLTNSKEEKSDE